MGVLKINFDKIPSTGQDLKILNRLLVRDLIRKYGPISRNEIAQKAGLTPSTITVITGDLIKTGIIKEAGYGRSGGGRRPIMLELNPGAAYVLAVRIQKGDVLIALFDLAGNIVSKKSHFIDSMQPEELGKVVADTFYWLCSNSKIDPQKVLWCGVASPGLIDSNQGIIVRSSNLNWRAVKLKEIIANKLGNLPVHIEQNANAAALAELERGSARGYNNFIYLNLSVGISAAFIIDGKIYSGEKGYAGEIGHSVLFPKGGQLCACGKKGCFEAACGVKSIIEQVVKELGDNLKSKITIDDVVSPPLINNPTVRRILTKAGYLVGIGIANLLSLFNPKLVILGGNLAKAGNILTDSVIKSIKEWAFEEIIDDVKIVNSKMLEDPQLVGAAVFALQNVFALENWGI